MQNERLQLSTAVDNLLWVTCQITGMHWIQLIWIVRVSVLDANDEYNDDSISPTGIKNGEKINAGKVIWELIVSNFPFFSSSFSLLFFVS